MLIGDLFGAVLVDSVVVAGDQCVGVAEGDLLLAGIALTLDALAVHAGAVHTQSDIAQQWLHPRRGVDGVVDVVIGRLSQPPVAGRPGIAVGVVKHHELQFGADEGGQTALRQPVQLGAQDGAWRRDDRTTTDPLQISHHQRGAG